MREMLCALLCVLSIAVLAQAERYNVAVDPNGAIYAVFQEANEVIIRRLAGSVWKIEARLPAAEPLGTPALAWVNGGMLAVWSERAENGGELVFAHIGKSSEPEIWRLSLPFVPWELALDDLDGATAGVLAVGDQVRWLEVDVHVEKAVRNVEVPVQGSVRFPSILPGSTRWIAWEERSGDALSIAAARIESGVVKPFGRFRVRGFGAVAMPVMVFSHGPAIVWQGSRDERAALFTRSLNEKGFGPVRPLPAPDGLDNVIQPRRAAGSYSVLSAATWNRVRWSAVRYDLGGEQPQPRVSLRVDAERNMLRPVVAVGEEDTWLWSSGDGEVVKGSSLSSRVFERPAAEPAIQGEMRYLAFGDSITAGKLWLAESDTYEDPSGGYEVPLQELIGDILGTAVVVNAGVSGENTIEGLVRLQSLLEVPGQYGRVLLLEGTNDFTTGDDSVLEVTIPNLTQMVALIRARGAVPVVGTMLPRDRHPTAPFGDVRAKELTKAIIPTMQRLGVRIAHFHELFPLDDEHLADKDGRRLHPTLKGYALMAEIWMEALLTFEGDVNRDGKVDYLDAQRLSAALGTRVGNFLFNPDGDVNHDGIINIFDLSFVYGRFGTDFYPEDGGSVR